MVRTSTIRIFCRGKARKAAERRGKAWILKRWRASAEGVKVDCSLPRLKAHFYGYTVTTRMNIGFTGVFTVTSNGYIMVTVTFGSAARASRVSHSFPPPPGRNGRVTVTTRMDIEVSCDSTVTSEGHIMVTVTIRVSENA